MEWGCALGLCRVRNDQGRPDFVGRGKRQRAQNFAGTRRGYMPRIGGTGVDAVALDLAGPRLTPWLQTAVMGVACTACTRLRLIGGYTAERAADVVGARVG